MIPFMGDDPPLWSSLEDGDFKSANEVNNVLSPNVYSISVLATATSKSSQIIYNYTIILLVLWLKITMNPIISHYSIPLYPHHMVRYPILNPEFICPLPESWDIP